MVKEAGTGAGARFSGGTQAGPAGGWTPEPGQAAATATALQKSARQVRKCTQNLLDGQRPHKAGGLNPPLQILGRFPQP